MNRLFKNLYSKWLNYISATEEGDLQSDNLMELLNTVGPRPLQSKITTYSVRYGSANFLDSNPGILTTWIAERGGWLLESSNKVFYYITGQSKTNKIVARALSGWPNVVEGGICPCISASEHDKFNCLCVHSFGHAFNDGTKLPLMQVLLLSLLIHYDSKKSKYPEHVILQTLKSKARLLDIGEDMIMGWKKASNTSFKQLNASSLPIGELDPQL